MNNLVEFLTSQEIVIIYALAGVTILVGSIVYFLDKNYQKRHQKQNTKELYRLVEEVNKKITAEGLNISNEGVSAIKEETPLEEAPIQILEAPIKEMVEEDIPVMNVTNNTNEDKSKLDFNKNDIEIIKDEEKKTEEIIEYTDINLDKTTAQQELEKLTEELMKAESKNIELTDFEIKQEENAIISLDELTQRADTIYEVNEKVQYQDEGNEPISIQDLEARMNAVKMEATNLKIEVTDEEIEILTPTEPIIKNINTSVETENILSVPNKVKLDDLTTVNTKTAPSKSVFKNSPFISPIFGIEERGPTVTEMELENTANFDKLDEEIRKTNQFLMTLKELQKNLE